MLTSILIRLITKTIYYIPFPYFRDTGKASLLVFQSLRQPHKVPKRVTFRRCHMFHIFRHSSAKTCIWLEIYLGWVLSWFVFTMVKCLIFTKVMAIQSPCSVTAASEDVSNGPSLSVPELKQKSTTAHHHPCTSAGSSCLVTNALKCHMSYLPTKEPQQSIFLDEYSASESWN